MQETPVGEIWGIGPRRARWLRDHEIETALQLMWCDLGWLRRHLSVVVARTALELRGVSCLPLEEVREAKKQICTSRSFGRTMTRIEDLREAVATFASSDAVKAREQRTLATTVTVFINTNPFRKDVVQYSKSCTIKLLRASYDTFELVQAAHQALEKIYRSGIQYHKAGVIIGGFVGDVIRQGELFEEPIDPRREELLQVMDAINTRFGREAIRLASTGGERAWRMKQCNRSPRYTTRWGELIQVH